MKVRVAPGLAMVHGYVYSLADDGGPPMDLALSPSGSADRIDRIILRLDLTAGARNITMGVLEGTPAANPTPPALTRTDSVKEISLGRALVRAASAALLEGDLTDERIDAAVCGMLVPPFLQLSSLDARYPRTVDGVGVDGAGDAALKAVRYGAEQALSAPQRAQARGNIGAAEAQKLQELEEEMDNRLAGKLDKASLVNNLAATEAGYALDARQGKALNDSINARAGLFDLLWTNNASTPAGTVVSYPSGKYDAIGVTIRSAPGGATSGLFIIPMGDSARCDVWQAERSWQRAFTAEATSLTCTYGTNYVGPYSIPTPGADGSIAYGDNFAIPCKVFGIKF